LQIKETRAEMADTIDAIQARLSPSGLIARAKETVRDVTVGRVKGLAQRAMPAVGEGRGESFWITPRLIQAVKENPLPVALIGLAATVLMVRTLRMGRAAQ
jgi:hypothetical protein